MPTDDDALEDARLQQAELESVYAQLDHLSEVASALYLGVAMIIEALEALPGVPGIPPVPMQHLMFALHEAKSALRLADTQIIISEEPTS